MGKGDQIQWKYYPKFANGSNTDSPDDGWGAGDPRTFTVPVDAEGPIVLDLTYWNQVAPFTAEQDSLTMFFRVNVGNEESAGKLLDRCEASAAMSGKTGMFLRTYDASPPEINWFFKRGYELQGSSIRLILDGPDETGEMLHISCWSG
ncbi:MAG: hypothetical protein R6W91_04600, partial [Thermoplasmata archaeon]